MNRIEYTVETMRGERLTLTAWEVVERQTAGEHFRFMLRVRA